MFLSLTTSITININSSGSGRKAIGISSGLKTNNRIENKPKKPSTVTIEEVDDKEEEEDKSKALVLVKPLNQKQERRSLMKTQKQIEDEKKKEPKALGKVLQVKPFVRPGANNNNTDQLKQTKLPTAKETGVKLDMSKALVPVSHNKPKDPYETQVFIRGPPYTVEGVILVMNSKYGNFAGFFMRDLIDEMRNRGMPSHYDNEAVGVAIKSFMDFGNPTWR